VGGMCAFRAELEGEEERGVESLGRFVDSSVLVGRTLRFVGAVGVGAGVGVGVDVPSPLIWF
jgi:hypothetical protein